MKIILQLSGCSAVMMAASRNRLECMLFLIAQGADWRRRSHLGRTALMQSAFWGATECCIHLVSLGGDPLELDKVCRRIVVWKQLHHHCPRSLTRALNSVREILH